MIHQGTRYVDREYLQEPSSILPGKTHFNALTNNDNISYIQGVGWQDAGLIQAFFTAEDEKPKEFYQK